MHTYASKVAITTAEYSTFSSPNYPSNYNNNHDRTDVISVSSGVVVIQFDYFNLEGNSGCTYDVLQVNLEFSLNF